MNEPKKVKVNNESGYIALYLSLALVAVIIFCYIFSGGSFSEQDDGFIWFFAGMYLVIGELPVTIASIIFGIKGLKNENKIPSYASFVINVIKIAVLARVFIIR